MGIKYDGNISVAIGNENINKIMVTDNPLTGQGSGGQIAVVLGTFGKGKSTLISWIAQTSRYISKGKADSYFAHVRHGRNIDHFKIKSTTGIWRLRDLDSFPQLLPENWEQRVPNITPKAVRVFVHRNDWDRITFFTLNENDEQVPIPNMPEPTPYKDVDDLIAHLLEGGINFVVEDQNYRFSPRMCELLQEAQAEFVGDSSSHMDDEVKDTLPKRKGRGRGRPQKVNDYSQYAISPALMWMDVIGTAMARWGNKPLFFFIDEAEDAWPSSAAGPHWWAILVMSNWMKDFRKSWISLMVTTHGWIHLHDSIYKRCNFKIMMPGISTGRNTMIRKASIINNLPKGTAIIEASNEEFGIMSWGKISDPMVGRIDGLKGSSQSLTRQKRKKIRGAYIKSGITENAEMNFSMGALPGLLESAKIAEE
jgi:hypothetical protein